MIEDIQKQIREIILGSIEDKDNQDKFLDIVHNISTPYTNKLRYSLYTVFVVVIFILILTFLNLCLTYRIYCKNFTSKYDFLI